MSADEVCLQCGETRGAVKAGRLFCCTLTVGEYTEVDDEWPQHRYRPWTDAELIAHHVPPADFAKHRRSNLVDLERWISTEYLCLANGHPSEIAPGICGACFSRIIGPASTDEMIRARLDAWIAADRESHYSGSLS